MKRLWYGKLFARLLTKSLHLHLMVNTCVTHDSPRNGAFKVSLSCVCRFICVEDVPLTKRYSRSRGWQWAMVDLPQVPDTLHLRHTRQSKDFLWLFRQAFNVLSPFITHLLRQRVHVGWCCRNTCRAEQSLPQFLPMLTHVTGLKSPHSFNASGSDRQHYRPVSPPTIYSPLPRKVFPPFSPTRAFPLFPPIIFDPLCPFFQGGAWGKDLRGEMREKILGGRWSAAKSPRGACQRPAARPPCRPPWLKLYRYTHTYYIYK